MSRCFCFLSLIWNVDLSMAIRKTPPRREKHVSSTCVITTVLLLFSLVNPVSSTADKITAEELVSKHLESIGTAKARASVITRILAGNSLVIFRTVPSGQATGRAVLASQGRKSLIGMSFPSPVYPREELAFNGSGFIAAFVTPGVRSVLGSFLMTHPFVFKEGLMGGTLSSAWPLLDLAARNSQVEYGGIKKIDSQPLQVLKYNSHGGSDMEIMLFFNSQTFEHVRTEYERIVPAPMGTRASANVESRETRYKMVEEFSGFKKEGELNLPHLYQIKLTVDSQGGTFQAEWSIKLTQFEFNQPIDPKSFSISVD
jgi:hypothetical protein